MSKERITRYFSDVYPDRNRKSPSVARKGENRRAAFLRAHFEAHPVSSLLDIGCGDGKFIFDIFHGSAAKLTLSDLSRRFIDQAAARFDGRPNTEFHTGDGFELIPDTSFDMITAIGVFDYWADWRNRIALLIALPQAAIVFSVPRLNSPRQLVRYGWLRMHGIDLQTVKGHELASLLDAGVRPYKLEVVGDDFMVYLPRHNQ